MPGDIWFLKGFRCCRKGLFGFVTIISLLDITRKFVISLNGKTTLLF
jgi:hypothetical protein